MPFRPECNQCLIPPELRCPKPKSEILQCLKLVNKHIEPDISLTALKNLIDNSAQKPYQSTENDQLLSISTMLARDDSLRFQIASFTPLEDSDHQIVAYMVGFKSGGEMIFNP